MAPNNDNKNLLAEFFQNSEMLLSIYDKNLDLIDVNNAFLTALRFEKKDIEGKNINIISPDCKSSGRYAIYEEVIRTGKTFVTDQVRLHPSLGSISLRLTAFKVGDGLGISSKNISDLKETIDDLETFIYKTSHDVRAPIATTLGLINVASEELKHNEAAISYFNLIKQQTSLLDNILYKLLETTKIRQGEKTIQLIDFENEIEDVINFFAHMDEFKPIKFETSLLIEQKFYTDKTLLVTLLQNLIHNAIKYQKEGNKHSKIKITVVDTKGGITINVEDNGIGIADEYQKDVFKMFFRATTKANGSGLGLYTVKHCVKKLGGHIDLISKEKIGTIFTIYIPNAIINKQVL
jgi:hypothetical protein